jgi:hypothetical protein
MLMSTNAVLIAGIPKRDYLKVSFGTVEIRIAACASCRSAVSQKILILCDGKNERRAR